MTQNVMKLEAYKATTKYVTELHNRITKSENDIVKGRVYAYEDVKREIEDKFQWLTA